jgi:hypothetical protein
MPNYDMSDTACKERAEIIRRLDKLDGAIQILADTCEDLLNHDRQLKIMAEINHEMIKNLRKELILKGVIDPD